MVLIRPQGSHCLTSITTKGCRKQGKNRWQWIICGEVDDGCTDEYQQGSKVKSLCRGENPFLTAPSGPGDGAVVSLANRGERWQNPGRRCAITPPAPGSIWVAPDHGSPLTLWTTMELVSQTHRFISRGGLALQQQHVQQSVCIHEGVDQKNEQNENWVTHMYMSTHTLTVSGLLIRRQTTDGLSEFCPTQITVSVAKSRVKQWAACFRSAQCLSNLIVMLMASLNLF